MLILNFKKFVVVRVVIDLTKNSLMNIDKKISTSHRQCGKCGINKKKILNKF